VYEFPTNAAERTTAPSLEALLLLPTVVVVLLLLLLLLLPPLPLTLPLQLLDATGLA
jgi:hypothetical protein